MRQEITWKSGFVSAYDGKASVEDKWWNPSCLPKRKNRKDYFLTFSKLDSSRTSRNSFANISKDHMPEAGIKTAYRKHKTIWMESKRSMMVLSAAIRDMYIIAVI